MPENITKKGIIKIILVSIFVIGCSLIYLQFNGGFHSDNFPLIFIIVLIAMLAIIVGLILFIFLYFKNVNKNKT